VERAINALRELPPVGGDAVARVVAAAARTRALDAAPNDDDLLPPVFQPGRTRYRLRVATAIAAAIVLTVASLALRRVMHLSSTAPSSSAASSRPTAALVPVARDANGEAAPIPTQFVFDGPARRVTLVGDFNNWDARATPLEREPGSTLWSVTVPIQRGRHVYAFLVDSVWTIDRRAPVARDADFGVTGSVILVGRP
jgi:hypothetical protein